MAIKRTNIRLMFYLTNQGVPDRYEVYYTKFNDTDPDINTPFLHTDPIQIDGNMTLNDIIIATRNALR